MLLPNSSGRYTSVQCRKAAVQLSNCLKEWSTFVLCENSTYIKFRFEDDNVKKEDIREGKAKPTSFYIVRSIAISYAVLIDMECY